MLFACGYSGVRVAAFFEKLAHFLAFVVKVGVVTAEASQSEKLREWDGIFYVLWMRGLKLRPNSNRHGWTDAYGGLTFYDSLIVDMGNVLY